MSITLKLDSTAVRELFPEGSEARVEVIKAVAIDFVKRCAVKEFQGQAFNQLRQLASNEAYAVVKDISSDIGFKVVDAAYGKLRVSELDAELKKQIGFAVKDAYHKEIREAVSAELELLKPELIKIVNRQLEDIPNTVLKTAKAQIVERLNAALK